MRHPHVSKHHGQYVSSVVRQIEQAAKYLSCHGTGGHTSVVFGGHDVINVRQSLSVVGVGPRNSYLVVFLLMVIDRLRHVCEV